MNSKKHWESVYASKDDHEVGWFQKNPETSLKLIEKYAIEKDAPIIDVGGGNSFLSKMLYEKNYSNLSVMDIAINALKRGRSRFKTNDKKITWIESNVLEFSTETTFQIWHDRAVFHFLINEDDIRRYAELAAMYIIHGGYLILGTFSVTGPKTCSGLPITQYDEHKLIEIFNDNFENIEHFQKDHITPSGNPQNFFWAALKRK